MKHSLWFLACLACSASQPPPKHDVPPVDDPPGDAPPSSAGMSATEFLNAMYGKDCDEAFTCKTSFVPATTGDTFEDEWGTTVDECKQDAEDPADAAAVEAEIIAGKIIYDPTQTTPCLAGISYTTCAAFWTDGATYPPSCDDALYGLVADGGACKTDWDCAGTDTTYSVCTASKCTPDPTARRLEPRAHRETDVLR